MKKIVLYASLLVWIIACGTPAAEETKATEPTAAVEPAAPVVPDPDPTDTIPGDQYLVNAASANTAALVKLTLQDDLKTELAQIDSFSRQYKFFEYDLNDDGNKEIFVGLTGPYFCGSGGCINYLLDHQGNIITRFTVVKDAIAISNTKTNGYKDLYMYSGGKYRIATFNGKTYPSNPSVLPAIKEATPGDGLPRALDIMQDKYPSYRF